MPEPTLTDAKRTDVDRRVDEAVDVALGNAAEASAGKRAALELAEAARDHYHAHDSFAGSLFLGSVPWPLIQPWPGVSAAEEERGDAFLKDLGGALREHLDADEVDETGEIPDAAVEALRKIGAFGIKIPEAYGGLGLSQTSYTRAAMLVGSHCASTTAFLSAHQSIGVPTPLKMFGTDEQKKRFLPRLAGGALSAFALTEEKAGSDPARMETTAVLSEDGSHWVLNGEKLWCTNGTRAELLVVMAKTPALEVGGRQRDQFTAFIVEADSPGVTVDARCHFMGMRALYNAVMSFKDVKVPAENIIAAEGRGMKVALATLNTGRLTLPAACAGVSKQCLRVVREWAAEREQWGAPIGKHAAVADKVARMAATVFAMESMTLLTSGLVDRGGQDIRLEAALCKMWGTEAAWELINDAVQVRGGRGYETANSLKDRGQAGIPLERWLRDSRINTLFEGSSEIMRLFIAREALDPHLQVAGDVLNSRLPMGRRAKGLVRSGLFYAGWYPKTWLPFGGAPAGLHPVLERHAGRVGRTSRLLARRLFHAMVRFGPKLEREQVLLGRFVEIGAELFAQSASIVRAQHLMGRGTPADRVVPMADLFCRGSNTRIAQRFLGIRNNEDHVHVKVAGQVLDGKHRWLEEGALLA
ncbi:MAG: acyl-CoA dehydrogenase family protein [Planctomycetota bacterium]|jgi:alkylation response protein AidB-like acyl-CoA dehydrogenase